MFLPGFPNTIFLHGTTTVTMTTTQRHLRVDHNEAADAPLSTTRTGKTTSSANLVCRICSQVFPNNASWNQFQEHKRKMHYARNDNIISTVTITKRDRRHQRQRHKHYNDSSNTEPPPTGGGAAAAAAAAAKGRRMFFDPRQRHVLEEWFADHAINPYPDFMAKQRLSKLTGLTLQQLDRWFINARARRDSEVLFP
mmetsp:Transcript_34862/g.56086  ORF Transcript_34862/g.56086 Transcript_34862/m.56086 type:complete len:196 (+) Transcript_34862:1855-2442(+)